LPWLLRLGWDRSVTTDPTASALTATLPVPSRAAFAAHVVRELAEIARAELRHRTRTRPLTLDEVAIPDSQLARQATELAVEVSPAFLVNHCLRTYLFGAAVGCRDRIAYDPELLYLAAILHDLALTDAYDDPRLDFELAGARASRNFLLERSLPSAQADVVHEAIALHTSLGITFRREPEVWLLHRGAGLDLTGIGRSTVHRQTRQRIVAAHPRLGFKTAFSEVLAREAHRKPGSHIAGDLRCGLLTLVARAPYDE
jgi:cyanamide hydratase family protein with HD domain